MPKFMSAAVSSADIRASAAVNLASREERLNKLNPNRKQRIRDGEAGSGIASANVTFT